MNLTVDAYDKNSDDLLNTLSIGGNPGVDVIVINKGSIKNSGIELALSGDIINTEIFNWNAYGSYSYNKVSIEKLGLEKSQFGSAGELVG